MPRPQPNFRVGVEDIPSEEIVAEHYQKTYELVYDFWKERNKYFLLLLVVAGIESLLLIRHAGVLEVSCYAYKTYIRPEADCGGSPPREFVTDFPLELLQSILLIAILYLMMQIYHRTVFITNMYNYLGKLEGYIRAATRITDAVVFTREGEFYDTNQRWVQRAIGLTYTALLGALLILVYYGRATTAAGPAPPGPETRILPFIDLTVLVVIAVFYLAYSIPVFVKFATRLLKVPVLIYAGRWWGGLREGWRVAVASAAAGTLFSLCLLVVNYLFDYGFVLPRRDPQRFAESVLRAITYLILFGACVTLMAYATRPRASVPGGGAGPAARGGRGAEAPAHTSPEA